MKKRIVCFVLTLIMLVSLVPMSAIPAAAASFKTSETAITVLKNLEGYEMHCENGYFGYGTRCKCPKDTVGPGSCVMYEKTADKTLRAELAELETAVNKFISKNGLSLTEAQFDALILFSFENGTAWTLGTGEFQTAVKSGYTGNKFLEAICKWELDPSDDNRRMIEANMYLNGVYYSGKPSRYIRVYLDCNGGFMNEDNDANLHYFDVATPVALTLAPYHLNKDYSFQGWYTELTGGERIDTLTSKQHDVTLYAMWQDNNVKPGESGNVIKYTINKTALKSTTVYNKPNGDKVTTYINEYNKEVEIKLADVLNVTDDYIDANGAHWARIAAIAEVDGTEVVCTIGWVKVKSGSVNTDTGLAMDVTVTVTNTYVNMRKNASITSTKNGSFNMGESLRIIDTKSGADGFLWGQVATGADDDTPIGWVALMYTDYDSVIANNTTAAPESVIATATIRYTGYVNVRSDAGINNQIVGALSHGVTVDVYEIKFVNGIRWGRCSTGWFCLTYANVTHLVDGAGTGDIGFTNYIFTGTLVGWDKDKTVNEYDFFEIPGGTVEVEKYEKDSKGNYLLDDGGNKIPTKLPSKNVKIASLRSVIADGMNQTWANTEYGWIKIAEYDSSLMDMDGEELFNNSDIQVRVNEEKYYALADDVTVRQAPRTDAMRYDVLLKGTEFNVKHFTMVGESIWGYARKEGEVEPFSYVGWVNLSNQNVGRNGYSDITIGGSSTTGKTVKMARVVGTDSLRVRITGATYGTVIGSLSNGTTAKVLDEKNGWYMLDIDVDNDPSTGSWVSGSYLELYDEVEGGSSNSTGTTSTGPVLTGLGMVANTYTGVNIRSGAGTAYPASGKYLTGTTVEILEVKTVGASKWGRTEKGWVCMDYIVMVDKYNPAGSGNAGSSTTTTTEYAVYTGKITQDETNIYKIPSVNADPVRTVNSGYPITLHEMMIVEEEISTTSSGGSEGGTTIITIETSYWARVNEGYIRAPQDCIELNPLDEHVYTVAETTNNVYTNESIHGIGGATFKLTKDQKVSVTQLRIIESYVEGYVEFDGGEGWVPMSRMTKGFASSTEPEVEEEEDTTTTEPTTPSTVIGSTGNTTGGYVGGNSYKYTGKVINTKEVNVRATASTTANITTTLKSGSALVIYETVISEAMAWGRCDSGWVYLYYVDLTPVGNGAVDARVIYKDNTIIYKDMNMSEATGSTYAKMAVVDIYEIVGKMARTEMGWVHTDNLL